MTVVICAYTSRRLEVLAEALKAVREQLREGDELVLVIDHNTELLAAVRDLLGSPAPDSSSDHPAHGAPTGTVRVIQNDNQRGLSGARNAGVAAARGELIVFLDDDAVPRPDWLARITEPFAAADVIGAGGVAAPAWEREPPDWLPQEFLWVVGCSYRGLPDAPAQIRNPIGATMAFRRSAIVRAGGFTDGLGRVGRLPLGCEETELSIRASRLTGGRIIQQPSACVAHLVTADRLRLDYFVRRCWAEGISKAVVARLAGGEAALASERRYTTRTLPAGFAAGIRDGLRGEVGGFKRAAAILGGLTVTIAGYVRGTAAARRPQPAAAS